MSRLGTITRRGFLVGSVAVAGGVAFGTYQVMRPATNPLNPEDGVILNPWIIIDDTGITVIVPRGDMGQGVQTSLAAMVAEELEAPLEDLRIAHGPPSEAYGNAGLLMARGYGDDAPGGVAARLMQEMPKIAKLQVTGGSTSVVDGFYKMRRAGASAREVMLLAGSEEFGVGLDQLRAEKGHIITTDGRRKSYIELAPLAARITPPDAPRMKRSNQWKVLGKSQRRLDQPAKATGTAQYGIDVRLPDMRFATVKMSPRFGAAMTAFDPTTAEAMPGVEKVVDLGTGFAVIATNTWLAIQAAEAVDVTWGEAPYPATTEGIFARIEAALDDKPNITARDQGDVEAAGPATISARYQAPFLAHAAMEPMSATALYDGDRLEMWAGNQIPVILQREVAKAVDLKKGAVTINTLIMGGSFGRRLNADFGILAARVAKAMPGVPVQTTWSREEDMSHDYYRPGAVADFEARIEGGAPVSLRARLAAPSLMKTIVKDWFGISAGTPTDSTITEGCADQPYAIGHQLITGHAADLDLPVGSWRSVGNSQNAFFMESFIDEMAHAADADPLLFRLGLIRPEHEPTAAVLDRLRTLSDWDAARTAGRALGVAVTHSFGTPAAEVIEVVDEDGSIRITDAWIVADPGLALDPHNVEAQLFGGCLFGLSAAVHGQITFDDGMVVESNFYDFDALRMNNAPRVHVEILESSGHPQGIGEPGTPPAAPALANALFALTGTRARRLPLGQDFTFVSWP